MREKIFKQCLYIKNKAEELKIVFNKYREEFEYRILRDKIDEFIEKLNLITLSVYSTNEIISSLSENQMIEISNTNEENIKILEELIEVVIEIENINDKFENLSIMMEETEQQYVM